MYSTSARGEIVVPDSVAMIRLPVSKVKAVSISILYSTSSPSSNSSGSDKSNCKVGVEVEVEPQSLKVSIVGSRGARFTIGS